MTLNFPISYLLSWLYFYFCPSTKANFDFGKQPISCNFSDHPDESKSVRLLFFGDMMNLKNDQVPEIDTEIALLFKKADLVIGNCESPVTYSGKASGKAVKSFFHNMAKEYVAEFLTKLGIDPQKCVLSVANNHIGDQGKVGLKKTIEHLCDIGISVTGYFQNGANPVTLIERKGIHFGIVGWTHWLNWYLFQNCLGVMTKYDIEKFSWTTIKQNFGIDFLIGFPHWDREFRHFPALETYQFANTILKNGFNMIVGHHPHVLQPIIFMDKKLCSFSLGNLTFPGRWLLNWAIRLIGILEVRVTQASDGHADLAGYALHPFLQTSEDGKVSLVSIKKILPQLKEKIDKRFEYIFPES